jgi:hypothetical protein
MLTSTELYCSFPQPSLYASVESLLLYVLVIFFSRSCLFLPLRQCNQQLKPEEKTQLCSNNTRDYCCSLNLPKSQLLKRKQTFMENIKKAISVRTAKLPDTHITPTFSHLEPSSKRHACAHPPPPNPSSSPPLQAPLPYTLPTTPPTTSSNILIPYHPPTLPYTFNFLTTSSLLTVHIHSPAHPQ